MGIMVKSLTQDLLLGRTHFMKSTIFRGRLAALLVYAVLAPSIMLAQAPATARNDIQAAIRKEGMERSRIMQTLHRLTDEFGPRLTGSPNHVNAARWATNEMKSWGFDNTSLEPWDFGRPGWVNERAVGLITAPVQDTLTFEVLAWTPSTKGVVAAEAVNLVLPERPTLEQLTAFFSSVKGLVNGKVVLIGRAARLPVSMETPAKRTSAEVLKRRYDPNNPQSAGPPFTPPAANQQDQRPGVLSAAQVATMLNAFLLENGALVRVNDAARQHGQIRAFQNNTYDVTKVVPTVVMRNEDFGRITRLLESKVPVRLEFDIRNRVIPEGATSYNALGEIVGTDKKDEVVMLGGHLDSWHAATGATDNAIGCAVMMEAARILKAIGVKPRRTIRVALWSGEEQGLLGSRAYVRKHFGTAENPLPSFTKFNGYFNIDSGTGFAHGMTIFGPPETAAVLREALAGFSDYGFAGVTTTRSRRTGGSDHTSFNNAGLPGIDVDQDPIEYNSHTWHTNLDTYERIIEDDVKKSAIIIASAVYELAMREEMLPRFKAADMPPAPTPSPSPSPSPAATPRP
jgi:carboxypeptidase Q